MTSQISYFRPNIKLCELLYYKEYFSHTEAEEQRGEVQSSDDLLQRWAATHSNEKDYM